MHVHVRTDPCCLPERWVKWSEVGSRMNQFIDESAPSVRAGLHRQPEDLPHGFIAPPPEVARANWT